VAAISPQKSVTLALSSRMQTSSSCGYEAECEVRVASNIASCVCRRSSSDEALPKSFIKVSKASARNFTSAANNGYWLPLPAQVDGSNRFFPDFLWWIGGRRFAIETSGRHLLASKVRGKLLSLIDPAVALIARGQVAENWSRNENAEGWTLVRARHGAATAMPEHYADLATLLAQLRGTPTTTSESAPVGGDPT